MNKTLKPCPFCGAPAFANSDGDHSTGWEVGCSADTCIVNPEVWGMTKQEAIRLWNARHTPDKARSASALNVWEPIATAPKDGTRILLAKIGESDGLPEFDVPPTPWSIRWATMGSWSSKYQKWWDGVEPCGLADPNYWMRLVPPKPPNAELSRDEPRSGEESA